MLSNQPVHYFIRHTAVEWLSGPPATVTHHSLLYTARAVISASLFPSAALTEPSRACSEWLSAVCLSHFSPVFAEEVPPSLQLNASISISCPYVICERYKLKPQSSTDLQTYYPIRSLELSCVCLMRRRVTRIGSTENLSAVCLNWRYVYWIFFAVLSET